MEKSIVVGVDDSTTARAAARTAADLAAALGAELLVVTAYGKYKFEPVDADVDNMYITTEALARTVADAAIAELAAAFPRLTITPISAAGRPGDALVSVAERHNSELIVVGNKRVQGIARVFGSIARHVATHAPCDVYIANTHTQS